ncbi:MAG: hypothetical protein JWP27_250 [Flaviaesturariibacter sp.]|nr:hypothetical protein [Flaviaesturariibacter sp.]
MNVYFISGLGADRRVFARLALGAHAIHHLDWIPFARGESLASYARRLSAGIEQGQPYAIVGLSLGGMLAAEMASLLRPRLTILLSSAPTADRLPPWLRWIGWLRLQRLVPDAVYGWTNPFVHWIFGVRTNEEKALFRSIVRDADPVFVRRAIEATLYWNRKDRPAGIVHLHGDRDRLLPARYARPDRLVRGGGHLMVFSLATVVSGILTNLLDENEKG